MNTKTNHGLEQASAQMDSVAAMVAALSVDYDRLEELREERNHLQTGLTDAQAELAAFETDGRGEELAELEAAAGDCEDADDARQRIEEDALSVEVRSGWESVGETLEASEYRIVLCTGGPHVEIVGDLNQGQPSSARLLYQDWGTGEIEYFCDNLDRYALIAYASVFYFGE